MPRPCERVRLESGSSSIELFCQRNPSSRTYKGSKIGWTKRSTGERIASGLITANMNGPDEGWLNPIGSLDQHIPWCHVRAISRQVMVFCLPTHEPQGVRAVDAAWAPIILHVGRDGDVQATSG